MPSSLLWRRGIRTSEPTLSAPLASRRHRVGQCLIKARQGNDFDDGCVAVRLSFGHLKVLVGATVKAPQGFRMEAKVLVRVHMPQKQTC